MVEMQGGGVRTRGTYRGDPVSGRGFARRRWMSGLDSSGFYPGRTPAFAPAALEDTSERGFRPTAPAFCLEPDSSPEGDGFELSVHQAFAKARTLTADNAIFSVPHAGSR